MNLTTGLLRANKIIQREACLVLYARNMFDFTDCTSPEVTKFLEQIGDKNAGSIQSIYVDFPRFRYLDLHDIELGVESARVIACFEGVCGGLRTCTLTRGSATSMVAKLVGVESKRVKVNALALVDSHFRAIMELGNVVVELDVETYSRALREEMRNLGWVIEEKEEREMERNSSLSE